MGEDIINVIQRKIWTVEAILPQANELASKANRLHKEARKSIPLFTGDWSEDNINKHLERLRAAIRDPLRYKNRRLLEDIGIQTEDIPGEIFDDSLGVEDIAKLFSEIREFSGIVIDILVKKRILSGWLKEGIDKTKEKLRNILGTRTAFQRIIQSTINENFRDELLQRSVENREFIASAEDIISKGKFIDEFKISMVYCEKFDEFCTALTNVYDELARLQGDYGIQKEEITELVQRKPLKETHELLKKKLEDTFEKRGKLLEEWKMYSQTLKSIGCEVPELPQGLQGLEKGVAELKEKCRDALGEEGLYMLAFLKGERDFPDKISKNDIIKTLEILRPVFVKFLKEEG